jgi:hypothetical protein
MLYPPAAVERAMKVRDVIVRAIGGELTWIQAAEILGCTARSVRRLRWRDEHAGYDGLLDHRRGRPSALRTILETHGRTLEAANRYLCQRFVPTFNATFGRTPADPTPAFVPVGRVELDQILCHDEPRVVGRDNTVVLDRVVLQIDKQRGRRTCAGLPVLLRRHLDGRYSIWWGPRCLGRYTATGRPLGRQVA